MQARARKLASAADDEDDLDVPAPGKRAAPDSDEEPDPEYAAAAVRQGDKKRWKQVRLLARLWLPQASQPSDSPLMLSGPRL